MNCEATISWDTDHSTTTNLVHWGTSGCGTPSYPHTEAAGSGKSHSVTFSVADAGQPKINYYIESSATCGSETTGCRSATSGPCIAN